MAKTIEVTITPEGDSTVDLKGFQGKGCDAVIAAFQDAFGGTVTKRETKPEHYQTVANTVRK